MKLFFEPLIEPIELSDEYARVLVLENQKLFYSTVSDIYSQSMKKDGVLVLSKNGEVLDISKNIELISQFVPFDVNQKNLINKLHKKLTNISKEQLYVETKELLSKINRYVYELTDCYDSDLEFSEIDISELIKIYNVRFMPDSICLAQDIVNYCRNVVMLDGTKLFIFINLRNYIQDEEFFELTKSLIDHKYYSLFIENVDRNISTNEFKTIIDKDLCVI